MISRALPVVCSLSLLALAACSAAPGEDPASSTNDAITNGTPSTHPVVQINVYNNGAWDRCSGTLISDSYVLTAFTCLNGAPTTGLTVCETPHPGRCSNVVAVVGSPSNAVYGTLLRLETPITKSSYPAISRTHLAIGSPMTCAAPSPLGPVYGPTEGPFVVGLAINPARGWFGISPTGGAQIGTDRGDGCFQGDTLVALEGKGTGSVQDASFLASWVDSVFCGARTCGNVVEGSHTISCGTCEDGARCANGTCVRPPLHCSKGQVDCGGYCAPVTRCW